MEKTTRWWRVAAVVGGVVAFLVWWALVVPFYGISDPTGFSPNVCTNILGAEVACEGSFVPGLVLGVFAAAAVLLTGVAVRRAPARSAPRA